MKQRLGIYIHIPFCASKCSYCDFYSLAGCDHLMPEYHKALIKHIEESSESIKNYEVDSVYFGGGTPSFYGAGRIVDILNTLKLNGNLRLDSEVTVEVNPDSITPEALKLLRKEGVNRLSVGVQASDNDLLKLIGRRHNYQQAQRTVTEARKAGFDNISLDLMYGLPTQTKSDWAETLSRVLELQPEHLSCYGLKLEEGTGMYRDYLNSPVLPSDDDQADMYCYAAEMLERYGYKQYEISNFAVRGFESRHNLKYWKLDDYMGFGPGAHSCVGNLRYSYIKDLKGYIAGIQKGVSIIDEYEVITPFEKSVEYLMLAMRTNNGVSAEDYRTICRSDWTPVERVLKAFMAKGWVARDGDRWHFTIPGFLISNTLIGILLEAQADNRLEEAPWLGSALSAEEKTNFPQSEDELFIEMYNMQKNKETADEQ